jgi:hypothetical protein
MLWDRGTWTPQTDDIDAALKKGDLKFTLDGYKLKGSWVLVRTSGRFPGARGGTSGDGSSRSWLLIKHRDEWSGDLDIAEFAPKSVKSEGHFEDILAEDTPAVWITNKPARPAVGGDTGAMLARIIEKAAAIKSGRAAAPESQKQKPRRHEDTKKKRLETRDSGPGARNPARPARTGKRPTARRTPQRTQNKKS